MRLIDADGFEALSWNAAGNTSYNQGFDDGVLFVTEKIDAAPTIDATPVVRCRDCKEWEPHGRPCGTRNLNGGLWLPGDFCSEGERRNNDAAD